ncbi:bifunctional aminoglycoside phosphotransferase/ATP-binding protein [Nakamurella panacisegetis]|uniref:bifunctional aminoglycoside phosphotransferase/ATP-binding protein n=1 Tax=Nakamurella panacisegetis TaxID=1090615 RepID=UPI0018D3D0A1|nr:bifunctional aminoglycoside phosphotransferase/ATP-binding protein [Nakamurella panacisegetis]
MTFIGDKAFKIKKPVDLGFLDFTTPQARKAVCHRELELNRRLAPDVYLDVAEVSDGAGRPCDWILVMRRMPADRRLSTLVRQGADVDDELRALAKMLAAFHSRAERGPRIDAAASAAGLERRWRDNLDEMSRFRGDPLEPDVLDDVAGRALGYIAGRAALFRARAEQRRNCDGHGDLIADDVFCLPDGPRALDCLEFDDRLRWVDGLDDACFLAMDLERLGAPRLGSRFLDLYAEFSAGPRSTSLEHHYTAYRALVRAKVACLRHEQGVVEEEQRARFLLTMAQWHLRVGQPRLILVGGLPGTGKSTLSGALADQLNGAIVRSDRVRKEINGIDPEARAGAAWEAGLYRPEISEMAYAAMLVRAREMLDMGETVVLDASWSSAAQRARARSVAADSSSPIAELRCTVGTSVAMDRIARRRGSGDPSDATGEIATTMAAHFDPWPEAAVIDTGHDPQRTAQLARSMIDDRAS